MFLQQPITHTMTLVVGVLAWADHISSTLIHSLCKASVYLAIFIAPRVPSHRYFTRNIYQYILVIIPNNFCYFLTYTNKNNGK